MERKKNQTTFCQSVATVTTLFTALVAGVSPHLANGAHKKLNKNNQLTLNNYVNELATTTHHARPPMQRNDELMLSFLTPVNFTTSGITNFMKTTYNNPLYGTEFLPHNFNHLVQFLEHGTTTKQSKAYIRSVVRLFNQKIKASSYVNAYAFAQLLEQMPRLLAPHFSTAHMMPLEKLQESINDLLYGTFISQFTLFKNDPGLVIDDISSSLTKTFQKELAFSQEAVTNEQLRQTVMRFLEQGLNKVIWSPDDHDAIWQSVATMSRQLTQLVEQGILIDVDDLDDLSWSLVHRFCYFLDLTGKELPINFYEKVKREIVEHPLFMLELAEQEQALSTKMDCLMNSLLSHEAKVRIHVANTTLAT